MNSTDDIISQLLEWFFEKFKVNIDLNEKIFDSGLIDSFEIIDLVVFIESMYKVKFSSEDFKDPRFFTVNGLSELIVEKISDT